MHAFNCIYAFCLTSVSCIYAFYRHCPIFWLCCVLMFSHIVYYIKVHTLRCDYKIRLIFLHASAVQPNTWTQFFELLSDDLPRLGLLHTCICRNVAGDRTVKKLRLSKALTIPEGTTVLDACRRMAARRVDAVLLTDANALLSGIVTDKVLI